MALALNYCLIQSGKKSTSVEVTFHDCFRSEQVCTVWNRGMAEKIYLEPLNKDEMILIGYSPSNDEKYHPSGWGGSSRGRSRGFGGDDRHEFPEAKSFIINVVSELIVSKHEIGYLHV